MDRKSEFPSKFHHPRRNDSSSKNNPAVNISIYTVLSILMLMRTKLGLEAMLEYTAHYLRIIEEHNPDIKYAVCKAISLIDLEVIYKDAMRDKKE